MHTSNICQEQSPSLLHYCCHSSWSKALTMHCTLILEYLKTMKCLFKLTISLKDKITQINSKAHPACGQYGLVAMKSIAKGRQYFIWIVLTVHLGTCLGDYTGFITSAPNHSSAYIYYLFTCSLKHLSYYLDAQLGGNETRYINDFRGTGCLQNVAFCKEKLSEELWSVTMVATQDIKEQEELLCDYGTGFWSE